jgi:hypothetical protein
MRKKIGLRWGKLVSKVKPSKKLSLPKDVIQANGKAY